jgi:hypothetical protein
MMQPKKLSQVFQNLKLKILIYGSPGTGKTTWCGGAPRPLFVACETGVANGLLPLVSRSDVRYVEVKSLKELDDCLKFAATDPDSDTVVLDSVTAMVQTFIRAAALAIPRRYGDTDKRRAGIPELDDYGVMGELLRSRIHRLLEIDKHIIITALSKFREPDVEKGVPAAMGPMLPGQAFEAIPGMMDHVFYLESKRAVKNSKTEYYRIIHTVSPGVILAKTRISGALPPQLAWDGTDDSPGSFQSISHAIREKISSYNEEKTAQGG